MSDEIQPHENADRIYRALGRYLVEFSQLIWHMQSGVSHMAGGGAANKAWRIGLAGLEADRLRRIFFVTATETGEPAAEEERIRNKLFAQMQLAVE